MSQENVDVIRRGWEHFQTHGEPPEELMAPDFVWDMSTFRDILGVDEQYVGAEGVRRFLREWGETFDDWRIEVESYHDAGEDKVVTVCVQHGTFRAGGVPVEMRLGQVWTVRDGLEVRMQMYADPDEALRAAGLAE
jgi:ketosteroid isomerase-like protein